MTQDYTFSELRTEGDISKYLCSKDMHHFRRTGEGFGLKDRTCLNCGVSMAAALRTCEEGE